MKDKALVFVTLSNRLQRRLTLFRLLSQVMSPNSSPAMKIRSPKKSNDGSGRHGRSSGRGNGRKPNDKSSKGVSPMDTQAKNYDNKELSFSMVFQGHPHLSMVFPVTKIPKNSFSTGTTSEAVHRVAKQAILDNLLHGLSNVFDVESHTKEGLEMLVLGAYRPTSTGRDSFSFQSFPSDSAPRHDTFPVAARNAHNSGNKEPTVVCHVPTNVTHAMW